MWMSKERLKFYTPLFVKMELEILFVLLGWLTVFLIAYTVYINLTLSALNIEADIDIGTTKLDLKNPRFLLFYAPWCPWSKKAKKHWDAFREELERYPVTFGGQQVTLEDIDGDIHRDMVREFKIREYPTFKLVSKKDEITMQGYPSVESFREFLVKNLGREEPAKLGSRVR
jgi:thiol-disulfide isomerase/thioredoxin